MTCPAVVKVTVPGGPAVARVTVPAGPAVVRVLTPGPPGPASTTYKHQESSPKAIWTINHNLGFMPSVELLDSGSKEIEGDVVHTSINQVIVHFTVPIAGLARLV